MPILSKYLSDWQQRMKHEFEQMKDDSSPKTGRKVVIEN